MLKAVIFDLNGIFIQSPKLSERFANDFGVPVKEFIPKLSLIMDKVRQPNAGSSFQYWKPVFDEWKINLTEQEFWDYWFKAEKVAESMITFATELKSRGIKVFILSNNFKERAEYYNHYPWIHSLIEKAYFSWQSGYVKPNKEAWLQVLREYSLKPEECIYFDDQEKNVKAAESVGIKSYIFDTEENLKSNVRKHL